MSAVKDETVVHVSASHPVHVQVGDPVHVQVGDPVHVQVGDPVHVQVGDLLGPGVVFCPNPKMPLWSTHPKVYLDVATTGEATCPYCGTKYVLDGPAPHRH